ncbi:MAG TPA: SusC/RagA family TonB-linked outer membrane protein, partial [Bacteroidales bacterium]|nr:SusC/RagA family TonB-linked outer membrane protein [Bacteroidales bacterium]
MTKLKLVTCLLFAFISTTVLGQVKISGTVTDAHGETLPGVNVFVKDLNQGGITNLDGKFSFSIPEDAEVLVFSFMGYKTQEVPINGEREFSIVMEEESVGLDEAIVVAYGTTKRASFTGSASVVKSEKINEMPVTSFEKALAGQVTGVQVSNVTGQPGSASEIRIRGMGSINASNSPLYVIDGVPVVTGNMNNENSSSYSSGNVMAAINPSDIESITVLKDAAAASLYGSRAANGVILITTKKGKAGDTKFNFKAYHGVSDFAVDNFTPASGEQYLTLVNEGLVNRYGTDETKIQKYRDRYDWYVPEEGYTDWVDLMFDKGKTTNYEFSARGGNQKTTFFASGSYFDQDGMTVNSALERITGRINLSHTVNDYVQLGVNILQAGTKQTYVPGGSYYSNPFYNTHVSAWPIESPYSEEGELVDRIHNDYYNVYREKDLSTKTAKMNRNMSNGWVELKPSDFLTFKSTNALDWINHDEVQWSSPKSRSGMKENGTLGNINQKKSIFTSSNILTFDKTLKESHHINLLAGVEYEDYNYKRFSAYGKGLPNETLKELNVAAEPDGAYGYTSDRTMISYLSRLNYDYRDRYYVSASFRRDGSSKLGVDERWGNFYSLSGSWRISEEAFMQSLTQVNNLKIRTSYGFNGNLPVGNYDHLALYSFGSSYNGTPAAVESQIANAGLTWEKNQNLSAAIEF